jgi:hypothetical protein
MKKNILVALFLSLVLFVGSKAFIALFSYQAAEKLKQSIGHEVAITYAWLSSELDGTIVFHDVAITPYRLKRTFYIDRLKLNYGNYFNLLLNLPHLTSGRHDGLQSLKAVTIKGKLEGRDFEEWLALEHHEDFSQPLGLYACGDQRRVSHNHLREMGINEYFSSLTLRKTENVEPGAVGLSVVLDRGPLGETKLNAVLGAFSIPSDLSLLDIEKIQLNSLSLTHVDNGYFRRLSNFCANFTQFDRTQFSENASMKWQQSLSAIGFEADENIRGLYRDYILQGGQLVVNLRPSKPFVLDNFKLLMDKDLVSYFGVSAKLNGTAIQTSKLKVNGLHFYPPVIDVIDDEKEMSESIEVQKSGYLPLPLEMIEQSIQQKVRLVLLGGKEYQGLVVKVSENKIELSQMLAGGSVAYSLQRDQIISLEMWH